MKMGIFSFSQVSPSGLFHVETTLVLLQDDQVINSYVHIANTQVMNEYSGLVGESLLYRSQEKSHEIRTGKWGKYGEKKSHGKQSSWINLVFSFVCVRKVMSLKSLCAQGKMPTAFTH